MLKAGEAFNTSETTPLSALRGRLQRLKNLADVVDADGYAVTLQDMLRELEALSKDGETQIEPALLTKLRHRLIGH